MTKREIAAPEYRLGRLAGIAVRQIGALRVLPMSAIAAALLFGIANPAPIRAQSAPAPSAPPRTPEAQIRLAPAEIELYEHARTLIDWTLSQVRNSVFLRGVRPASQDQLALILERVGQTSTLLFRNFTQVSCDEDVTSREEKPDPSNRRPTVVYPTRESKFRYIVIPLPGEGLPGFDEYRTDPKGNPIDSSKPGDRYMLTSGFTSISLYLGPADQQFTRFRYFGTQTVRSHKCHVVGFAQDPMQVRRVGEVQIYGKRSAILVQGLAWIDSATFQVLRVKTWLLAPRMDIGLSSQLSTVDFYSVRPVGSETELWLPRDVRVEIDYRGREIRNTHHYSNFKLFRVETTIKTG